MSTYYRVIEIIDEYSLIINYGFDGNARAGDTLRIFVSGEEIIDPETKQSLGTLDTIKATVEVVTPYQKFSICKNQADNFPITNPLSELILAKEFSKKLHINAKDITARQLQNKQPIKVGDLAVVIPS